MQTYTNLGNVLLYAVEFQASLHIFLGLYAPAIHALTHGDGQTGEETGTALFSMSVFVRLSLFRCLRV